MIEEDQQTFTRAEVDRMLARRQSSWEALRAAADVALKAFERMEKIAEYLNAERISEPAALDAVADVMIDSNARVELWKALQQAMLAVANAHYCRPESNLSEEEEAKLRQQARAVHARAFGVPKLFGGNGDDGAS